MSIWSQRGSANKVVSLTGHVSLLGQQDLASPRLNSGLFLHRGVIDWLRDVRNGLVIVDAASAGWLLVDAGHLQVESSEERYRLKSTLRLPEAHIEVADAAGQAVAA